LVLVGGDQPNPRLRASYKIATPDNAACDPSSMKLRPDYSGAMKDCANAQSHAPRASITDIGIRATAA